MSYAPHLTLITELLPITRRDFSLVDASILDPNAANPLLDGEWLEFNDTTYAMKRGSTDPAVTPQFQVFAERGRYDTQAIGKVPVLFLGGYEAETDVVDVSNLAVGSMLTVSTITMVGGATNKRGLIKAPVTGQRLIFGWVTRLIGSGTSAKVRFWKPAGPTFVTIA